MHKIIEIMINENIEFKEVVLQNQNLLDEPILLAMRKLMTAKDTDFKLPIQDTDLKKAIEFNFKEASCKELSILYLMVMHNSFSHVRNEKRENIYLKMAVDLFSNDVHKSVATLAFTILASDYGLIENHELSQFYYQKAKEVNPFQTIFDFKIYINFFLLYRAFSGYLKREISNLEHIITLLENSNLTKKQKEQVNDLIDNVTYIDAVGRGDIEESRIALKKIKVFSDRIQRFMMYMYIQKGVYDPREWEGITLYNSEEKIPIWTQIDIALLKKQTSRALELSKKIISPDLNLIITNTYVYIIRSELANKNTQAVEWLLKKYANTADLIKGTDEFILFHCFLELSKNNREKAAEYFVQAFKKYQYYGKEGMLKHQIDMSPQLSVEEIAFLYTKAATSTYEFTEQASLTKNITQKYAGSIIGLSSSTNELKKTIKSYANLSAPVLITGETGSGKELVASELHNQSDRSSESYVTINCSSIPDSLLQSELFGHEAGSYTSADKSRKGIFESAGKGTVFLDEFGDISPLLQVSLLRVMEKMEVRPVGSNTNKKIYCRFIIATNANLENLVANNLFRKDLYYRVKQLEIKILPLRERKEDILYLAYYFLNKDRINSKATMSKKLEDKLLKHSWEGNVRELKHEIERARLLSSNKLHYEYKDMVALKTDEDSSQDSTIEITSNQKNDSSQKEFTNEEKIHVEGTEENLFQKDLEVIKQLQMMRKTSETRLARIMNIFKNTEKVYRQEIAKVLGVTPRTISSDFKQLLSDEVIIKIEPSTALRSHYFTLKK